jgi:hypothetical protein
MNKNEINQAVIAEIKSAIARSISHTEIVRVNVTGKAAQTEALEDVSRLDEVAECDYAKENDGSLDVWGTTEDGSEFRIRIISNE